MPLKFKYYQIVYENDYLHNVFTGNTQIDCCTD